MAAMEEKLLRGPLPLWKLLQKYIGPGMGAGYWKCPLFMVRGEADRVPYSCSSWLAAGARPGLMTQVSWDQTSMPGTSPRLTSMLRSAGR